jgi:predicted CXXCH cytochrome family protein
MLEQHDRKTLVKRVLALLVVVCSVSLFPAWVRPAGPQTQQAKPAGQSAQQPEVGAKCTQCHKLVVESFALDAHGKSAKFLKDSRAATCESCHGAGTKHIETGELADIINPPRLTTAQANESCLQCHTRDRKHMNWRGGPHDRNDMSCLSCHSAHHAKLLDKLSVSLTGKPEREIAEMLNPKLPERMLTKPTVEETCLSCHSNRRADFYKRSTHLFRTELGNVKVGCSSCHNPHGGEGGKMLLNHSANNLCYTCHAEKRGPFLWDHPPVRENCMNCHSPHGSSNPKLLTARVHLLCQQCHIHMLPRHSTTAGKPLDIWSLNRGCVNCHALVHGSNHPGGRTLGR